MDRSDEPAPARPSGAINGWRVTCNLCGLDWWRGIRMFSRLILTGAIASIAALAQDAAPAKDPAQEPQKDAQKAAIAEAKLYLVEPGTHIPISMINSVSTKNSVPGDPVYFE